MNKSLFIVIALFVFSANIFANDNTFNSHTDSTIAPATKTPFFKNANTLNVKRFAAVNATSLLALYGSYHYINTAWWADSKKTFHFDAGGTSILEAFDFGRDAIYAKGLDKVGHFYGARITSDIFARGIRGQVKRKRKRCYGVDF